MNQGVETSEAGAPRRSPIDLWRRLPGPHDSGLSEDEFRAIQEKHGFEFPPDLRELLADRLPVGEGWPNWRAGTRSYWSIEDGWRVRSLADDLAWPLEGMLFDVEHNAFWQHRFGERPNDLVEAFECVRRAIARVPLLVPIYKHRYIPASPSQPGNPVLSVWQTDIIVYGTDLASYLEVEFFDRAHKTIAREAEAARTVEFWSDLLETDYR